MVSRSSCVLSVIQMAVGGQHRVWTVAVLLHEHKGVFPTGADYRRARSAIWCCRIVRALGHSVMTRSSRILVRSLSRPRPLARSQSETCRAISSDCRSPVKNRNSGQPILLHDPQCGEACRRVALLRAVPVAEGESAADGTHHAVVGLLVARALILPLSLASTLKVGEGMFADAMLGIGITGEVG